MEIIHTPVLLKPCLEYLSPLGESYGSTPFMIDSTLGEGGHTEAFLSSFKDLNVLGLDADCKIQARAKERLSEFAGRVQFFYGRFNDFYASYSAELPAPNIILFDLGISVFHYERSGRGFSFRYDEPLDMRLDPEKEGLSAFDVVNTYREQELSDVIFKYGEEKYSRRIARAIVSTRASGKIESSKTLAEIIFNAVPANYRYGQIHPATRTFQAIRILVNNELNNIPEALHNAFNCLSVGGKLGVITFHSLEDRIVKNYFRNLSKKCVCPPEQATCTCGGTPCAELLTKKPIGPTEEEIKENSPSRSAKLRVVRKICNAKKERLIGVEGF